jgi:hypothetical protein
MERSVLIGLVLAAILFVWMQPRVSPPVFGQAPSTQAPHIGEGGLPRFEKDPAWPKVPAKWKMGFGSAVAIDADDHVWVLSRPHTLPHTQTAMAAPPVMEFDNAGNFIQGWGGESGPGYQWPSQPNSPWRLRRFRYGDLTLRCRGPRSIAHKRERSPAGTARQFNGLPVYQSRSKLKLYVPSQRHPDLQSTSTRALNPVNCPVPSENVHSPRPVAKSSVQRPTALLPFPASRTTLLSSKPAGIPAAWS